MQIRTSAGGLLLALGVGFAIAGIVEAARRALRQRPGRPHPVSAQKRE